MGVIIYSFNLNISPQCHMVCLSILLLCYRITCLGFYNKSFCNKKGALFVPDPVYVCQRVGLGNESGHPGTLKAHCLNTCLIRQRVLTF